MEILNLCGFLNFEQRVQKDKWLARKDEFGIRCYSQEMEGVKGLEGDCCNESTVCLTNVHFFAFLSSVIFANMAPSSLSLSSPSLDDDSSWVHSQSSHLFPLQQQPEWTSRNGRHCLFQLLQGDGGSSVSLLHEFHCILNMCSHLRGQCSFWKINKDLFFNWSLKVDWEVLI